MNSNKLNVRKKNTSNLNVKKGNVSNLNVKKRNTNVKKSKINTKEIVLGIDVEESASQREVLDNLKNNLKKNNEKVKQFKSKITDLRKFNNKLSSGYQLSLQMVVDVSDLLHRYVKMFEMLENLMANIESTFEFSDEDFRYIKDLTEKSIEDIRTKLNNEIDSMVVIFEKQGLNKQASEMKKFKETTFEISSNASNITKTTIKTTTTTTANANSSKKANANASKKANANANSSKKAKANANASKKANANSKPSKSILEIFQSKLYD